MRFLRRPKYQFTRTRLKELAAERRLRREREALPLFAEQIQELQPSIDEIIAARERAYAESEKQYRDRRAREWREARRILYALEPQLRQRILTEWNQHRWYPSEPFYLRSLIKQRSGS